MSDLSTIDRLHQGQTEEPYLAKILRQDRDRARRRAEASAQAGFEAEARALPTELFAENPELVRLTTAAAAARARAEQLAGGGWRAPLVAMGDQISAAQLEAEHDLLRAALDDVAAGDVGLPRALEAFRRELSDSNARAEIFRRLSTFLNRDRTALNEGLWAEVRAAETARVELLAALKRDHLKAQAEE